MTGWENKNKVLKAVKEDGLLLQYASETLRNDSDMIPIKDTYILSTN